MGTIKATDLAISSAVSVGGTSTLIGAVSAAGAVTLGSTVSAAGAVTLGSTVSIAGAVTTGSSITLSDNELVRPVLKDYGEKVNAIGSIGGGTQDIDLTLGNIVTGTVDTATTTFTFSNPTASGNNCGFALYLINGGSQTVNWPGSVDWPGAIAPTLTASGTDILVFNTTDGGTTWYGNLVGAAYA